MGYARTSRRKDVVREMPKHLTKTEKKPRGVRKSAAAAEDFGIEISSPERVIFPDIGLTKKELADYYATGRAADHGRCGKAADDASSAIPRGRPRRAFSRSTTRGTFGPYVKHIPIKEKDGDTEEYLYFDDIRGLLACVQMGTIEFHGWGSKIDKVEYPDRLVFDLDPDVGLDFAR